MIEDISQDEGITKVVQIVVNKSIKYTTILLDSFYLRCSGCKKSVHKHFPFLNPFITSFTSAMSGMLLLILYPSVVLYGGGGGGGGNLLELEPLVVSNCFFP